MSTERWMTWLRRARDARVAWLVGALGAAAVAAGCTGSAPHADGGDAHVDGAALDRDADPTGDAPAPTPLYLLHSATQSPSGDRLNYFTVVDSLAQARRVDYARSIELPGRPRLYGDARTGFFAIGSGEDVTITRFTLRDDGTLARGASLSLAAHGVTRMAERAVLFVSPTKAYYKDDTQAQVIVWNPTEMTIERRIDLPAELVRAGMVTNFSDWAAREGEAYFAVGTTTREYDRVTPGTSLVRIDTATDAVTVTPDARCRGLERTARQGDALYFFSGVINGFGHAVYPNDGGQQDCILRVSPGRATFDADYVGTVAPALGAGRIGVVITVTDAGEAWVQAVDLATVMTAPGTAYGQWYAGAWRWWHLPLATLTNAVQAPGEPGAYSAFAVPAGTGLFISQARANYAETTLLDLSGATPAAGLTFPGFPLGVVRIR